MILPPRTFQSVKDALDHDDTASEEDDEDEEVEEEVREGAHDETYKRVKVIIEGLIESGKRALEVKPEDFFEGKSGAKVLHAEEVRMWRDSGGRLHETNLADTTLDLLGPDDSMISSRPVSPSSIAMPDSDMSEGEDVTSAFLDASLLAPAPPITVTPSL